MDSFIWCALNFMFAAWRWLLLSQSFFHFVILNKFSFIQWFFCRSFPSHNSLPCIRHCSTMELFSACKIHTGIWRILYSQVHTSWCWYSFNKSQTYWNTFTHKTRKLKREKISQLFKGSYFNARWMLLLCFVFHFIRFYILVAC